MISSLKTGKLLLLAASLFLVAEVADMIHRSNIKYFLQTSMLNREISKKEKKGLDCLNELVSVGDDPESISAHMLKHVNPGENNLLYYRDNRLVGWTDNSYNPPRSIDQNSFRNNFINLQGRYLVVNRVSDSLNVFVCLIDVWNRYEIENEIIKSGYVSSLNMPDGAGLTTDPTSGYPVYGRSGNYLFSATYEGCGNFNTWFIIIPVILWISFLLILLLLVNRFASYISMKGHGAFAPLVVLGITAILYLVVVFTGKPDVFSQMNLFSPYRFAIGRLIPSTGHMAMVGIGFLYFAWSFYRWFPVSFGKDGRKLTELAVLSLYMLLGVVIFFLYSSIVVYFIKGSNISFEIYKILDIDYFTIVAFLSSSMILLGLVLYLLKIFMAAEEINDRTLFMAGGISVVVIFLIYAARGFNPFIQVVWSALLICARFMRNPATSKINVAVLFGIIAGAYASWVIPSETWKRETDMLKVMAVNYSNDNDLYAESLLYDTWSRLEGDSLLMAMMSLDYFTDEDADLIYRYLDQEYFNGYWENYSRIYTVCSYDSDLILEGREDDPENCFYFFNERIKATGVPLADTGLVFIENNSGRAYYLGSAYFEASDRTTNGLFIELVNEIKYVQSGYPELLVDSRYFMQPVLRKYGIAKYIKDTLVMQTGVEPFDQLLSIRGGDESEYLSVRVRDFDYLVFNRSDKVSIVIRRPSIRFIDILVIFTYVFIGFFILFIIAIMLVNPAERFSFRRLEFRHKMQFAFVAILLGTMVSVGSVVIYLSVGQYRAKHLENIREKLSSVNIEMEHKLSTESALDEGWNAEGYPSLDDLLVKFSNVFYTDINLFDMNGNLMASSRREVFDKNLVGRRMNYAAYEALSKRGEFQFVHQENIGDLRFLSAYIPFFNKDNQLLAYLNLPILTCRQNSQKRYQTWLLQLSTFPYPSCGCNELRGSISARITAP
ncbi:MAG: hypothetical protein R2744_07555 [Bacteroidales bacterium]